MARGDDDASDGTTAPSNGRPAPQDYHLPMGDLRVRAPAEWDFERWRELYRGYAAFYRTVLDDEVAERVWTWIQDPAHDLECVAAEDADGRLVGIAHFRAFPRPLLGSAGGFLDDLFVEPEARGTGAGGALLAEVRRIAGVRGWSTVRWITADDNHRARARYDQVATRTMWVTYDMAPAPPAT